MMMSNIMAPGYSWLNIMSSYVINMYDFVEKDKKVNWQDKLNIYELLEFGLLNTLDNTSKKLEDHKCEKSDLMEKGLLNTIS